jgi:acyl-CoA synthetase (NDP forming)
MTKLNELEAVFYPKSVAVIGASTSLKFGSFFVTSLQGFGFKGKIYPVNPRSSEIFGLKAYPNVKDIPEDVDLAAISIPARFVPGVLEDCVEKGVKAAEIFTAGFSELGEKEGIELERKIVKIAKKGIHIVGPNCFGVYCPESGLTLLPGYDFSKESGNVAFIGQSGGYSADFCMQAKGWGIHFSKLISYGNASDLNEADYIEYFSEDPETKIITAYIEGVRDGRRFFEIVQEVTLEKPVIIWKGGLTNVGARAVASHTGSLGGGERIWNAFFEQSGAIQANNLEELIDMTITFLYLPLDIGRNFSVIGGGGGITVAAADACERMGISIPTFTPETQKRLREVLPQVGNSVRNPLDMGAPIIPLNDFRRILEIAAEDPQIDMLIIDQSPYVTYMGLSLRRLSEIPAKIREEYGKPVVVILHPTVTDVGMLKAEGEWRKVKDRYLSMGIPVYLSLERAAKALSNLIRYRDYLKKFEKV